ncbi:TIGR01244 family sulfur transferase [Qipengyuania sp. NPDC077563]|uniref:TIGR01244 family sulfur transferase n=1 Tax=Qipengyuania sp. NPDC077563 TaxID=3364497 RepID=UPI00384F7465
MVEFKQLREGMLASPQIEAGDVARAKEAGVTLIINNRPDGEAGDQPAGADIEAAAQANGIAYRSIPVSSAGFSLPQIEEMKAALDEADGTVLAFCRSGTRSTILWALAKAKSGAPVDQLSDDASAAGYDLSGIQPTMKMLSRQSGS